MTTRLTKLRISKVVLCGIGANPEAEVMLFKMAEAIPDPDGVSVYAPESDGTAREPQDPGGRMADEAEVDPQVEELTGQVATLTAELDALRAAAPEAEIDKSALPEPVRKALEEAEGLKDRVAKMEHDARLARFTKQAADDFGDLAPSDELGPVLEEIDRLAPESAKKMGQILSAVAARAETSALFKELGSSGGDAGTVGQAQALIAKAQADGLSYVEAQRKVFAEHPELWEASK